MKLTNYDLIWAVRRLPLTQKRTIGYLKEHYKQPKWCNYPNALDGPFGCWSLMDLYGDRKKISREFCSKCDCYIPIDKTLK